MTLLTQPCRSESIEILCHEVRGAIAPLANWQRLLHRSVITPEELGALADVLQRTVLVLSRLVNDFAALEHAGAHEALSVAALDLREVVSSVTNVLGLEAVQKDIALGVWLPPEPVPMLGDFVRLTQVIANLLDNALKFTERRGRVSVELRCEGGSAKLSVTDTGIGIAPEFLPVAFEQFTREDRQGETIPGRGIGLHVVKDIVELHGGTVMAESPGPGRGSRFTVVLPVTVPGPA
jgi:signal transduction histidine kinase